MPRYARGYVLLGGAAAVRGPGDFALSGLVWGTGGGAGRMGAVAAGPIKIGTPGGGAILSNF
jgi:hypothetical protein